MDGQRLVTWLVKPAVFAAALVPLALLVWDGFTDGLGANPVEAITWRTGDWTLRLLLVTLAVTPLRRLTGWQWLVRLRRMLGLFAFFYLSLHFATYAVLDASLDPAYVVEDVLERPYITVGFMSLCLLVPLAATSTNAMIRRLGGKRWRRLHRLVYPAAAGGVLHFLWQVKANDYGEPLVYAAILTVLLALRLPPLARRLGAAGAAARGAALSGATPRTGRPETLAASSAQRRGKAVCSSSSPPPCPSPIKGEGTFSTSVRGRRCPP